MIKIVIGYVFANVFYTFRRKYNLIGGKLWLVLNTKMIMGRL